MPLRATALIATLLPLLIWADPVGSETRQVLVEPRPLAIPAANGHARFTLLTPRPGSRTLLVVSALARGPGIFPIRLGARSIGPENERTPAALPGRPGRAPSLGPRRLPAIPAPVATLPPSARTFHLMVRDGDVASASNYLAIEGRLRAIGQRIQVYVDEQDDTAVGPEVLRDLIATFDGRVFPLAAREFGQARDVDGDGRFTVLMSSWLTRLAGGRHAVDGFVRGADLDGALAPPYSNHCDMMYLSTALKPGAHLRTVLAHEYTHAVTFSARADIAAASRAAAPAEEGWLDEAIAHLVEDRHGFSRSNLDYRVSAFLSCPERYRLVVEDYYAADLFRSHGNRGGTYLFLRWCVDRFGPELIPALIQSDRSGIANLEAATGRAFEDLYREWSLALFTTGFQPAESSSFDRPFVDTRAALDGWDLAGPRTFAVAADAPDMAWSSASTASRYVVVGPSRRGAVEVTVVAPAEAGLQITALPLPDDLADPELRVREVNHPGAGPRLRFELRERNGTALRLSAVAWEPLVPGPDPHAAGFRRAGLDREGIIDAFGTVEVDPLGRLVSGPVESAGALQEPRGPLVVKAVGTDALGRRVAAWAEVAAPGNSN